jgi:hypothetical protein
MRSVELRLMASWRHTEVEAAWRLEVGIDGGLAPDASTDATESEVDATGECRVNMRVRSCEQHAKVDISMRTCGGLSSRVQGLRPGATTVAVEPAGVEERLMHKYGGHAMPGEGSLCCLVVA